MMGFGARESQSCPLRPDAAVSAALQVVPGALAGISCDGDGWGWGGLGEDDS